MEPDHENQEKQDDAAKRRLGGLRSRFTERLDRGRQAAGQAIQRSGDAVSESAAQVDEALTKSADRAGLSDQLDATRRGVRRSGEVLSRADIRQFDEFTDAVTRVVVGLHRDQAELASRLAQLEQTIADLRQENARMTERLAGLEKADAGQSGNET